MDIDPFFISFLYKKWFGSPVVEKKQINVNNDIIQNFDWEKFFSSAFDDFALEFNFKTLEMRHIDFILYQATETATATVNWTPYIIAGTAVTLGFLWFFFGKYVGIPTPADAFSWIIPPAPPAPPIPPVPPISAGDILALIHQSQLELAELSFKTVVEKAITQPFIPTQGVLTEFILTHGTHGALTQLALTHGAPVARAVTEVAFAAAIANALAKREKRAPAVSEVVEQEVTEFVEVATEVSEVVQEVAEQEVVQEFVLTQGGTEFVPVSQVPEVLEPPITDLAGFADALKDYARQLARGEPPISAPATADQLVQVAKSTKQAAIEAIKEKNAALEVANAAFAKLEQAKQTWAEAIRESQILEAALPQVKQAALDTCQLLSFFETNEGAVAQHYRSGDLEHLKAESIQFLEQAKVKRELLMNAREAKNAAKAAYDQAKQAALEAQRAYKAAQEMETVLCDEASKAAAQVKSSLSSVAEDSFSFSDSFSDFFSDFFSDSFFDFFYSIFSSFHDMQWIFLIIFLIIGFIVGRSIIKNRTASMLLKQSFFTGIIMKNRTASMLLKQSFFTGIMKNRTASMLLKQSFFTGIMKNRTASMLFKADVFYSIKGYEKEKGKK